MTTRSDDFWDGRCKMPWDDPEFSRRMLEEHLTQAHDLASRRLEWIERQVHWIHETVLGGAPSRILDLGCGPGLYCHRLAALGHRCHGIDFGPSSIAYARRHDDTERPCTFTQADIRTADYGGPHDLAMILYGELNVFSPADALAILARARKSLSDGGRLIIEMQTADAVAALGAAGPTERHLDAGLFSDRPHLLRTECRWVAHESAVEQTFTVTRPDTRRTTAYRHATRAWTDDEVRKLVSQAGVAAPLRYETWPRNTEALQLWLAVTEPS